MTHIQIDFIISLNIDLFCGLVCYRSNLESPDRETHSFKNCFKNSKRHGFVVLLHPLSCVVCVVKLLVWWFKNSSKDPNALFSEKKLFRYQLPIYLQANSHRCNQEEEKQGELAFSLPLRQRGHQYWMPLLDRLHPLVNSPLLASTSGVQHVPCSRLGPCSLLFSAVIFGRAWAWHGPNHPRVVVPLLKIRNPFCCCCWVCLRSVDVGLKFVCFDCFLFIPMTAGPFRESVYVQCNILFANAIRSTLYSREALKYDPSATIKKREKKNYKWQLTVRYFARGTDF